MIGFAAGALIVFVVCLATIKSEAEAAEAHARAAEERAETCEAKFDYSTVIVETRVSAAALPPAAAAPGINLMGGALRLSLNSPAGLTGLPPAAARESIATPAPSFVIPAQVIPRSLTGQGAVYYWINAKTNQQYGPFHISQDMRGIR